ncbi:hypothetical protein FE257_011217 [Aspergillus nanangensis]|uniref:Uncharacterized protein n=1 Tax=Aspergillus nanangensis TaxID=2582783 RepID=A0AAD4CIA0_ASPNN|nr:hypothetical protein FE257_011217 [Aspergillus nanangensis]
MLKTIYFSPPSSLVFWNGSVFPAHVVVEYSDSVTPAGDAHIVGFGGDERNNFTPELEPGKVVAAFNHLHPMKFKKTVFYNWCTNPYSNSGLSWWPPQYMSKYQGTAEPTWGDLLCFRGLGTWLAGVN